MARYINADDLPVTTVAIRPYAMSEEPYNAEVVFARFVRTAPTVDVRKVIEADGYQHLICPHCLSEFFAKTKAEMFCPDCGKKFFFSEKWCDFPYVGENIERGNGLP